MDCTETWLGSTFLTELCASDGLTATEAAGWIARKTARPFDEGAMYRLSWSDQEDAKTWGEFLDLRVTLMSDAELDRHEIEYRKSHGLAPRRPWETRLFDSSRGRSQR